MTPEPFADPARVREAFVYRFGASCAAWLIAKHRRRFKRRGAEVLFGIPRGEELPPWFDIAISFLRDFAPKWTVVTRETIRNRYYVVTRRRELPAALRPS